MLKFIKIGLVLWLCYSSCSAQPIVPSLEANVQLGKLWRHSPKMKFYPEGESIFLGLNLAFQTRGDKYWHHYYKKPKYGIGFHYLSLGKPTEILKDGFGLFPFLDIQIGSIGSADLRLFLGCGLAYLNAIYDIRDRPDQTAIGSHLNNLTCVQTRIRFLVFRKHFGFIGLGLTHISNGAYKTPNLGLNFISLSGGIEFITLKNLEDQASNSADFPKPDAVSNWSYGLEYGMSLKENLSPGGPKFLIQTFALNIGYYYSYFKSMSAAIEYEYNPLSAFLEVSSTRAGSLKEAGAAAKNLFFYCSHSWEIGPVIVAGRLGYALYDKEVVNPKFPVLTKLNMACKLPFFRSLPAEPYLGFSLKTRLFTADYIALVAGIQFKRQKTKV